MNTCIKKPKHGQKFKNRKRGFYQEKIRKNIGKPMKLRKDLTFQDNLSLLSSS